MISKPPLLRPIKRLGQNFLCDPIFAHRIVEEGEIEPSDTVMEPGAGFGTLTELIIKKACHVLAVEKDPRLAEQLRRKFLSEPRVEVLEGDVLRLNLPSFQRIIGTPPYNVSSKLVLLISNRKFRLAALVFQEEFGRRLVASPGSNDYGRLSVMAQQYLSVEHILSIPRSAFVPSPKVDSAVLKIRLVNGTLTERYRDMFEWIVREAFTQRRRLLSGSLKHSLEKRLGRGDADRLMRRMTLQKIRVFQVSPKEFMDYSIMLREALELEGISKQKIGLD